MNHRASFVALVVLGAGLGAAQAAEITRSGSTVFVRGRIEAGDDLKFAEVAPGGSFRAVELSSVGGQMLPAGTMARAIKAAGATTIYDAARGPCSSACTILFAAGAQRRYVNSESIREGLGAQGKRGLGYHEARANEAGSSGRAMGAMTALYYEMGSPAGAQLSGRSPNRSAYYISGATAVSLGIATSLSRP